MKRKLWLILFLAMIVSLCGCQIFHNDDLNIKTGNYIAGGTIPADAKIYPILNEEMSMTVVDPQGALTAEDIWILTRYVDIWSTCDDTRGEGFRTEDAKEFVSMDRIQQITESIENSDRDYSVDAVQILAMEVDADKRVQVQYVVKITGKCDSEGVAEGEYESIEALRFEKINDKWYEDGIGFVAMAESGTFEYLQDDITGAYTIIPNGNYIS